MVQWALCTSGAWSLSSRRYFLYIPGGRILRTKPILARLLLVVVDFVSRGSLLSFACTLSKFLGRDEASMKIFVS
ncbi:hypothetical protein GYMLUDRAFT_101096, partial [Collybiopsis luxurians FD-317 M1]